MQSKICACCKHELPATREFFLEHHGSKDNLYCYCKECSKIKQRERKARIERERVGEQRGIFMRHIEKTNPKLYKALIQKHV
jgi:hypothetical protein